MGLLGESAAPIDGEIKTVTVSKNKANQYFASILFDNGLDKPESCNEGKEIGIDLGLTYFAITSEGSKFDNPKWIAKHEQNLKIKQQQLSRKQKAMKCTSAFEKEYSVSKRDGSWGFPP